LIQEETYVAKPIQADILDAIANIEADAWIDPTGDELMFHWCNLFDLDGVLVGAGFGLYAGRSDGLCLDSCS
jgi:hypothetical protein